MNVGLTLARPAWLAGAVVLMAAYGVWRRTARRAAPAARRRTGEALRGAAVLAAIGAAAWWLSQPSGPVETALLAALALVVLVFMVHVCYVADEQRARGALAVAAVARGVAALGILLILGRPVWEWTGHEWRKPALYVLLDQSRSMNLSDEARETPTAAATSRPASTTRAIGAPASRPNRGLTRAQLVNAALERASGLIVRLEERYDVRIVPLHGSDGGATRPALPVAEWRIDPRSASTPIAAALRRAADALRANPDPPPVVLLISDGAENVEDADAVRRAAALLADERIPLIAVGVGPTDAQLRSIQLEPLALPPRVALHDRLALRVHARIRGFAGATARVTLEWSGVERPAAEAEARVAGDNFDLDRTLEVTPPGPGVLRLTARVEVPAADGAAAETSAVIDVTQGRTRVLLLDGAPRPEIGFVARALAGDERFEVSRVLLPMQPGAEGGDATPGPALWDGFDVVLFGRVPRWRLTTRTLEALRDAVGNRGVGLLLAGGNVLFEDPRYADTPLAAIAPVEIAGEARRDEQHPTFVATQAGLAHPALRQTGDPAADASAWRSLPPLAGAASFGRLSPLSTTLATDDAGRPLLIWHEYGAGRVAAAAWDGTWPWALASDAGAEMHRRFWRQLTAWLANRRPRAWVLSDQPLYPLEPAADDQPVAIRAGVTGLDERPTSGAPRAEPRPELVVVEPSGRRSTLSPQSHAREWRAAFRPREAGEHTLLLSVDAGEGPSLEARAGFRVANLDRELQPPTSDLGLLSAAAALTTSRGGRFVRIAELEDLLSDLLRTDRRARLETRIAYDPVERSRWPWLGVVCAALTLEWWMRKRAGLP